MRVGVLDESVFFLVGGYKNRNEKRKMNNEAKDEKRGWSK